GPPPVLPSNPAPTTSTGAPRTGTPPPSLPPAVGSLSAAISGGSEFYRIQKDGFAERIWSSSTELIYAIAFDHTGKPLVGTGNRGLIYRIDSDQLSTQLLNAPPTQVTAFWQGRNGTVYAATGNVGNVYAIGPGTEMSGTLDSDVLDAGEFSHWGKVHLAPSTALTGISIDTRSGNVSNPQNNWSAWSKVSISETGGSIESPPARFLQYRLTLRCEPNGQSPELTAVDIAYLPKNIAPKVGLVEIAPFNYRESPTNSLLERNVSASGSPMTLTLSAVGQKRTPSLSTLESSGNATLQYNKGYVTIRWSASDPNGDSLIYKVEIRGKNESAWQTLKDKLQDRFYAFDSSAFPDGEYVARVTASDSPGNTPADALTASLESDPFTVDNTPPEIIDVSAKNNGSQRVIRFTAKDALSWIDKAEYSVNGGDWILLMPENFVTDSQVLTYAVPAQPDQRITVRVFDEDDNVVVRQLSSR
ncbi:MAG TPA: fibronectin type III domain-containing protein, partial [Bryobacteraceae bacterium]|nr:fibronectin type III domain-containing protein [Bryobacteraceae bacterium]